jgi:predicted permease
MKFAEAWTLSRIPYREVVYQSIAEEKGRMWWGAFGKSGSHETTDDLELAKRALRIAKFDKTIVAVFGFIISIMPFATSYFGTSAFSLASSVSMSLTITFGFTMLYVIQTLTSFVRAESSMLLSTLPITQNDFSLITLLSFIRSVDFIVAGSVLSQIISTALLTGSLLAVMVMSAASVGSSLFAVTAALWFSRVFQKYLLQGGRSKANTFFRLTFILMWGFLLIGVGFLLSIPYYIMPTIEVVLQSFDPLSNLLAVLYPFSTGIVMATFAQSGATFATSSLASISLVGYALLAILAAKWSLGTVKRISHGSGIKIARTMCRDFSIKIHSQLTGFILKDLKIASRNPATAFFFALPALETVLISLLISSFGRLQTSVVLIATSMGGIFTLLLPLALLSAEGRGLEYTKTLPIGSDRILVSKTLLTIATYIPVPLALTAISCFRPLTSLSSILIPFLVTGSVASASIFEIRVFLRATTQGRIAAVLNDLEKLTIGVLTVLAPVAVYALIFLSAFDHNFSLVFLVGTVVAELLIAQGLRRRL